MLATVYHCHITVYTIVSLYMPVLMCVQEFFTQSNAEKEEGLPVTPFMDPQKITKPSSQCSFIGFVLLPLFEALGELFSELQVKYLLRACLE